MTYNYQNKDYEIIIEKKPIKNAYIKVKSDLKIYVSVPKLTPNGYIKKLVKDNNKAIDRMLNKKLKEHAKEQEFHYLGKLLSLYEDPAFKEVYIEEGQIYYPNQKTLDIWLNTSIKSLFESRLEHNYQLFEEDIPFPILKLRNMTSRWGVCKAKPPTITLNKKLIRYDQDIIDYVIIHELAHFIHMHHQKEFWNLVAKYCPNYKTLRKKLKE